ncbi:MAG: transrane protein [Microvirga sp.]|nr:transrane protein [Microvirga sp.]
MSEVGYDRPLRTPGSGVLAGYLHEISTTRMDLAFLFVSAFAASTILPMSSEVVLGALAVAGTTDVWVLFGVATAGNTLGAVANWALGRYAATWRSRLISLDEAKFQRASRWFNRWGIWCLLLSWLPVIGDPLTLVAGVLRTAFIPFVLLVLVGKAARYLFVLFDLRVGLGVARPHGQRFPFDLDQGLRGRAG